MSVAICTGEGTREPHCPLGLYAGDGETSVIAEQYGGEYRVTHRYADGTIGVSGDDFTDAECDDEPMCCECRTLIDHWDHTEVTS